MCRHRFKRVLRSGRKALAWVGPSRTPLAYIYNDGSDWVLEYASGRFERYAYQSTCRDQAMKLIAR